MRTTKSKSVLPLAKVSAPQYTRVLPRTRLFKRLDKERRRSLIWISAPAGSGKTTLVANYLAQRKVSKIWYQIDAGDADVSSFFYHMGLALTYAAPRQSEPLPLLTPEYALGLSTFSRNFFRELFFRLKHPSVIVLDNYHEIPANSALHEMLAHGFDETPKGINIIVASRGDPPAAFARLQASERIAILRWNELQLTEQESTGIAELRLGKRASSQVAIPALHEQAQGWAAGLILMLEGANNSRDARHFTTTKDPGVIFDYFANEILRQTDPATRDFLLQTSFLPKASGVIARHLTGMANADAMLSDLTRRNYFTVKHPGADGSYEYHPLFRDFLIDQALAHYTPAQIKQLKQRSAQLLAENGDVETAVSLLQQAEDWTAASELILKQAPSLLEQGRNQTLTAWLQQLPPEQRDQNPWALYWLGISYLPFDPALARGYLEKAFPIFQRGKDPTPLFLTWSSIVDSFGIEWNDFAPMDKWLDAFQSLQHSHKPSPEIEATSLASYVTGLFTRRLIDPNLSAHLDRAMALFTLGLNDSQRTAQMAYFIFGVLWTQESSKAEFLIQRFASHATTMHANPVGRIMWCVMESLYAFMTCASEKSVNAAGEALALAEASGIRSFNHLALVHRILGYLQIGDVAAARATTSQLEEFVKDRGMLANNYYLFAAFLVSLHEGDLVRARQEVERAIVLAKACSVDFADIMTLAESAYLSAKEGDLTRAFTEAREVQRRGTQLNVKLAVCRGALAEAYAWLVQGDRAQVLNTLKEAFSIAKESRIITTANTLLPQDAALLCSYALDAGIHVDYVHTLIIKNRLTPPPNAVSEHWPYPVKLHTFGDLRITQISATSRPHEKLGGKPLQLLKALIAFGGHSVTEHRLCEALWPDADGDSAHKALAINLHRLRKLFGRDVIQLKDKRVTIDARYCWVDVWAFERQLLAANEPDKTLTSDDVVVLEQGLKLYRGAFLEQETEPWAITAREHLRGKFLRAGGRLGQYWERCGEWQRAIDWYQRAIEIDDTIEEFYYRLMVCYQHVDQSTDALATYDRCRKALTNDSGKTPAAKIVDLYRTLRS